jgi:fatty-acyl-CoA synthase
MERRIPAFDWTAHHARARPRKVALVDDHTGRRLTYAELDARAAALARWLAGRGVGPGDRVAFLAPNTPELFEALFACAKLRAILVPLNHRLAPGELRAAVADADPRALVFDPSLGVELDVPVRLPLGEGYERSLARTGGPAPVSGATHDDPWCLLYTSGTTGGPKGVILTHGTVFWNAVNISVEVGLARTSTDLDALPTFHASGLNLYATPCLWLGATVVLMRRADPGRILERLGSGEVTHFFGVPTLYQRLAEDPSWDRADLSGVRSWVAGGSAMPVALLERYAERGVVIRQGMGLTETGPTLLLIDEEHALAKAGSVGTPVLHTEVRLVGRDGRDVADGEVGELWVRGPNVTPGYWNRPEETAAAFSGGWFRTGDALRRDADGFHYVVDRWKDMFISGGENVYPAEVERVIAEHPDVLDVAVVGVPDERWGEVGVAVVVPRRPTAFDAGEVLRLCSERLARYKVPRRVVTVAELPRNAVGKVLKRRLREELLRR